MKNICLPLLITCFLFSHINAQETIAALETVLQDYAKKGWSGSALVARDGKILIDKGFGLADRESQRPQTSSTVFSIGSISKQFTAAGIMKLVSMEKISVHDPIAKYFKNVPADKTGITIHHLLTHSAGFPGALGNDYDLLDSEAFFKLAMETPLFFQPGTQYAYSNVGYSLLGILLEKESGMGYEEFLHENLWKPAGMTQTGYLIPKHRSEALAVGYRDGQRWGTAIDKAWMSDGPGWHLRANGGILSTAGDMFKWYLALRNATVLPKEAVAQMFTPHIAEGPQGMSHYGYGWTIQDLGNGDKMIWHNGGNGVYNAVMTMIPSSDICIIVSSNSNQFISDEISAHLHGAVIGRKIMIAEEPYRTNPVTQKILAQIRKHGHVHFLQHHRTIMQDAGFDFENDMQLLGVGEQLMESSEWDNGVALYTVYTQLFPRIVVAWNHLGRCKKALGDLQGAKAAWEKSIALRPQNNPAAQWLKEM